MFSLFRLCRKDEIWLDILDDSRFFQDVGRPARHLGFLKVRNFNCGPIRRARACHHSKFCAERSDHCGYGRFPIFRDGDLLSTEAESCS